MSESENTSETLPPLWAHQKKAIEIAGNKFALFFDPGVGKTRTAIELYRKSRLYLDIHSFVGKSIIFAPLNVCRNWENELEKYLKLPYKTWIVSGQTKLKKLQILTDFKKHTPAGSHCFLICNIESLRSSYYRAVLGSCGAQFIIVDESHNFKTPTSLQTKGLFEVLSYLRPAHLYLLTGTPAPQGEIDLWSTFTLLGKNKDSFFIWRKKYFDDKNEKRRGHPNYWPDYKIRPASQKYFQQLLSECSMSAKKDEVLDLPPLLRTNIYSQLSPEQTKYYETMKEFLFAIDAEGNELNAANMLSRTLRLQQILAGFLGDVPIKNNPRLQALDAAIEKTNGEQFIIWTIFKATYRQLQERVLKLLPQKEPCDPQVGLITGEQTAEERHLSMETFQAGKLRALICHPKAGGVGVNLTAASYSIHYTRSFSLVDDLQAEARNYRGGSEIHKRITRIDIITPDTIDEEISKALAAKKSVQDFILSLKEKHNGSSRQFAA